MPDPKHVSPRLALGDLWRYGAAIEAFVHALKAVDTQAVGERTVLPPFSTWLPDGHNELFELTATRKA